MTDHKRDIQMSGGCQCGAVRYHASAFLDSSHICHCRMCQKAVGNYFAALVGVPREALSWTRGEPALFNSSDPVTRGFCKDCGTPLTYDYATSDRINIATGSLDDPTLFEPKIQYGIEGRMPWFQNICSLPQEGSTEELMSAEAALIRISNHQHPDHDTADFSSKDA